METSGSEAGCAGWLRCASRGAVSHIGATAQRPREVAAGAAARDRDETRLAEIGRDGPRFPEMARDPRDSPGRRRLRRGGTDVATKGCRGSVTPPLFLSGTSETRSGPTRAVRGTWCERRLFTAAAVNRSGPTRGTRSSGRRLRAGSTSTCSRRGTFPRHFRDTSERRLRDTPEAPLASLPRRARDAPEAAPLVPRPCREGPYARGARKDARAHDGGVRQEHPRASAQRLRPKARAADGRPPRSFRIDREASAIRSKIEQERRRRGE